MIPDEAYQIETFKEAARGPKTDGNPERFKEPLGALVKHKPMEKPK